MAQNALTLDACAKLNLFLHVVGRRPDGMHLLESVFVLIDLADRITLEEDGKPGIVRTGDIVGDVQKDLCVRAATALQNAAGLSRGCRIDVRKRIPAGAGMGGGSSDCAATLLGLNRLWELNWPLSRLMDIGATLGADVPFFLFGRSAFAAGTGDKLQAIELPGAWAAVVMPCKPTSTGLIFQDPALTRDTKSLKISALSRQLNDHWPELIGHNDLQPVAVRINPEIGRALGFLGPKARMTGSGSAVFALFETESEALEALSGLPESMHGYAVRILPENPSAKLAVCR